MPLPSNLTVEPVVDGGPWMLAPGTPSYGCVAKMRRAAQHRHEVERLVRDYVQAVGPKLSCEIRDNHDAGQRQWILRIEGEIPHPPMELSLAAGDAIHNLR